MVKNFFEGIQWLFENILFLPHEILRDLNFLLGGLLIVCDFFFLLIGIALIYWSKKLKDFDDKGEEDKDVTAHSFFKNQTQYQFYSFSLQNQFLKYLYKTFLKPFK